MQYFGGKTRIAGDIARVVGEGASSVIEPFCGGLSVTVALSRLGLSVKAYDGNEALINMYIAMQNGWQPPTSLSHAEYQALKLAANPADPLTAFAAVGCSFSGRWFEGYARNSRGDNYAAAAASGLLRKFASLRDVTFKHAFFQDVPVPAGSTVYCDPPYAGTKWYSGMPKWDDAAFWRVASEWAEHSRVFVSEYVAPPAWLPAWSRDISMNTRTSGGVAQRTERIFTKAA